MGMRYIPMRYEMGISYVVCSMRYYRGISVDVSGILGVWGLPLN